MVKHNNQVPNGHFHKKWQRRVRTWLDQPARKKARRLRRAAKAAAVAPRPMNLLRPLVRCPTIKYNTKVRLGRGFTLAELKEAGISKKVARIIGIAVDHRRTNASEESLKANVGRLQEYKSKLVVVPRQSNQRPKAGDSGPEQTANVPEAMITPLPLTKTPSELEYVAIPAEEGSVYATLRTARTDAKIAGIRKKMKEEKEEK